MRVDLSSGDLARATGETVRTIRFYEEQGLLRPTVVSGRGRRRYTEEDLERLRLILDLREVGLSLYEIRTLLQLRAGCRTAAELAGRFQDVLVRHVGQARRRLERLRRVQRELSAALTAIRAGFTPEAGSDCPCAMAQGGGAPRIVKIVAEDGACQHHAARPGGDAAPHA